MVFWGVRAQVRDAISPILRYSYELVAIRRYSRTRMTRRFLIQGISYNRMRTRSTTEYKLNTTQYKLHTMEYTLSTREYKLDTTEYKFDTREYKINNTRDYLLGQLLQLHGVGVELLRLVRRPHALTRERALARRRGLGTC